jgi:hypothetical protein
MSLAAVQVPIADFNKIRGHLVGHMPAYRNMHLRKPRQRKRTRNLRYLHAMYAPTTNEIVGMISGPGVFWHYRLSVVSQLTQIQVLAQVSPPDEDARLGASFLHDVLDRVDSEQAMALAVAQGTAKFYSNYLPSQFYLRRALPGMAASHQKCQAAVSTGALDPAFVAQLQSWNFELLYP